MKKILLLSLLCFTTSIFADSSQIEFTQGWIKQLPPVVPMRAGYVQIHNPGNSDAEIIAVQSESFQRVEIHETQMVDGMMKMVEQNTLPVPAKATVELKPGGKHLMLLDPLQAMQVGEQIKLIFTFNDDQSTQVTFEVRP